jgi:hypothetical protein
MYSFSSFLGVLRRLGPEQMIPPMFVNKALWNQRYDNWFYIIYGVFYTFNVKLNSCSRDFGLAYINIYSIVINIKWMLASDLGERSNILYKFY